LLVPFAPSFCVACRAPADRHVLCPGCRRALDWLPPEPVQLEGLEVWAPLRYEGPARAVVRQLKFRWGEPLADFMAAAIAAGAPPGALEVPLVPVPGRRGFSHTRALAKRVAERAGTTVIDPLDRLGSRRQVGRSRAERVRTPPRFTFRTRGSGQVTLIDDVVTTGATLAACAGVLRQAGWSCGTALAYARTPVR
jgi:predicted amidophosphoribosyltransferase